MGTTEQPNYERMPFESFRALKERLQLTTVAKHISQQLESARSVPNLDRIRKAPNQVQVIFWLWRFISLAEGGGLEVFLLQNAGLDTPFIASAMKEIGAVELLRRLLAGVPLALQTGVAEFTRSPDFAWFKSIPLDSNFSTLQSVDRGAYPILYKELREMCRKFIVEHADVFLE